MLATARAQSRSSSVSATQPGDIPPGPRRRFPGDLLLTLLQDKLAFFARMARYGDVAQVRIGPQRVVLLNHPEDIRRVLVTEQRKFTKGRALDRTKMLLGNGLLTSEGSFHLRQRRLVQPALHRERVLGYGRVMSEYAERMLAGWQDGETRDIHADMMHLTLAVAGRTLFNVDVEREAHEVGEALDLSLRMFQYSVLPMGSLLEYAPIGWVRQLHRARRQLDLLISRMIAERRREGGDRGDLLSMLVAAHDVEGDGTGMTDRQLRDEIATLLMAGHETTANALTWTCYLLAQHPTVAATLEAEIDRVLGGRRPEPEDAPQLVYTRHVVAEGMRLYPPAWILERLAQEDFEAGGYRIPAGSIIYMSQYLVHRDPRWWRAPARFWPERWVEGAEPPRPKFAYFPFGGGTRICVGEHFAWLEATLVLAAIVQRWRLVYEEPLPPQPEALVTLRPKGGLRLRLERRPPVS